MSEKVTCDICGAETFERDEWFCDFLIFARPNSDKSEKYDHVCDDCLNAIHDTIERRKRHEGLKFEDVMHALRRGKNIRHKCEEDVFFYMLDGRLFRQVFVPSLNEWVICDHNIGSEIFRNDWEVVE